MSYCIPIAFSLWLELFIIKGHKEDIDFAFGIHGQNDPILIKEKEADFMKNILNDNNFRIILEGKRGTHSIRKMTKKRARKCGCTKDETDTRARWKQRLQQDSYADTILPWLDAKVAADIYKGGTNSLPSQSGQ